MATRLADLGGLSPADATAEFSRLLASLGLSVYLQVSASAPGAKLTLARGDVPRATLCVPDGFCCGAGQPSGDPDAPYVIVLWCRSATHQEFEGTCPSSARRMALVVNGRLRNVALEDLPLTYELVTA